jgi:hypothetical protein
MKGFALLLGGTLLIAGCTEAEGPFVDNLVRGAAADAAGNGSNVQEVRMTRQDDGTYSGFAMARGADNQVGRFNCTARRTEGRNYQARCARALDEVVLNQLEAEVRQSFTSQGVTVLAIELTAQDDNHVTGYADVREPSGAEGRLPCAGTRTSAGVPVNCRPPGTPIPGRQAGQPPADEGAQPAGPEEAPAEEGQ